MSTSKNNAFKFILSAGFLAGTLDICSAFVDYFIRTSKGPQNVLRFVASGVFGKEAFSGNALMPWFGLLFHYIIAFAFTMFFYWVYPRIKFSHKSIVLTAIVYGLFVWFVMNFIVVPLSNTPKSPFNLLSAVKAVVILICMIGLPLSILIKRTARQ